MTTPIPIPDGPIEDAPHPLYLTSEQQAQVLRDELAAAGVVLGQYDEHILEWVAGWDAPPVLVIASWIKRARVAAHVDAEDDRRLLHGADENAPTDETEDGAS